MWFAGNAVIQDLIVVFQLDASFLGPITSAVQFGFITGTLFYAIFAFADRYSPSLVFFISAVLGGLANVGIAIGDQSFLSLLLFRFLTGFFLAGIYPVGMKIASDHFESGLGRSLGYLVGALVLGTAFPHLLNSFDGTIPWPWVMVSTSALAKIGGSIIYFLVPDGPYHAKGQSFDPKAIFRVFTSVDFRQAAIGYFGHMWELYAFWAFVPIALVGYGALHSIDINAFFWSFLIIAVGSLSCVAGGYLSMAKGTKNVAAIALSGSGISCIISPILFWQPYPALLLIFLLIWGMLVIADSPLFSTLVAQNAPKANKGTALTIVTCIGFSITIASIQLLNYIYKVAEIEYLFVLLAIGPAVGVLFLFNKVNQKLA